MEFKIFFAPIASLKANSKIYELYIYIDILSNRRAG